MKLGGEFDAAKFLRQSLELGAVILNTESGVIYGVPTPVSDEMHKLLIWHNLVPHGWISLDSSGPFRQGDVIPYRALFRKMVAGDTYVLSIEYDTTQAGEHALDYLATFSHTISMADACSDYGDPVLCADVDIQAIPMDPQVAAGYDQVSGTSDDIAQLPGVFTLYGGTISSVSLTGGDVPFVSDSRRTIAVTFTADVDNKLVLAWGGHIATQSDWEGNASPTPPAYRMRFSDFQCTAGDCSTGPQELQLIPGAIVRTGALTVLKDTMPDSTQDFSFQATGNGLHDFQLDDDGGPAAGGDDTLLNRITFLDLMPDASYRLTETATLIWRPTGLNCVDPTGGTTTDLLAGTASIDLAEGETVTCTFTNEPLSMSASGITVTKTASPTALPEPGGTVTFTIMTSNVANVDATLESLVDDVYGDLDGQGTCALPQPVDGQGGSYACSFSTPVVGNGGDVHRDVVTATVSDGLSTAVVTDSTTVTVSDVPSAILVTKTARTSPLPESGDTGYFTVTVQNTSPVDMVTLTQLTDDQDDDGAVDASYDPATVCDEVALPVGGTATCVISHTLTGAAGDVITDAVAAWGLDDDGQVISDTDTASVRIASASLDIQKGPDIQHVLAGMTATFQITLSNVGDLDLADVIVSDPLVPACDHGPVSLAVGEQASYGCGATVSLGFTNVVTATGSTHAGRPVSDTDQAVVDILELSVAIEKTPDFQGVWSGEPASFTIGVANLGSLDLTGVTVSDPQAPDCNYGPLGLAVGERVSKTCSVVFHTAITNVATVNARDVQGRPVGDSDQAVVAINHSSVAIDKAPAVPVCPGGRGGRVQH